MYVYLHVYVYGFLVYVCICISFSTVLIANFVNISEQNESWRDARRGTWSVTSVVEYFDWLKKQPVNQVLQLN